MLLLQHRKAKMKKLILLIIVLVFGVSCSPFKKLPKNSPAYACDVVNGDSIKIIKNKCHETNK